MGFRYLPHRVAQGAPDFGRACMGGLVKHQGQGHSGTRSGTGGRYRRAAHLTILGWEGGVTMATRLCDAWRMRTNPFRTAIASHRGGLFLWPENSATAFRETARLALDQAECDVHQTADGTVVVMHDATLERTTDGRGPVGALDLADFRVLRVKGGGGEAPPTLAEYLDILANVSVAPRIEIKAAANGRPYPGIAGRVLAELDTAGQRRRAWIIGFQADTMAEVQGAGGVAGVAWLLEVATLKDIGLPGALAVARAHGFAEIGFHENVIDAEVVAACRKAGIGIGTWGANHAASIRRVLDLGLDIFATDDPPLAIRMRDAA